MWLKPVALVVAIVLTALLFCARQGLAKNRFSEQNLEETIAKLQNQYPQAESGRIQRGVRQAALFWQEQDGSADDFTDFCSLAFIADTADLHAAFMRIQDNLEQIYGHALQVNRFLSQPLQLDLGPILPIDYRFAEYDPFAHILDDLFHNRIAFTVLLNFPMHTLEERLNLGAGWSRAQWAQSRLTQLFSARVPAAVNQQLAKAYVQADDYISNYNIFMHQLKDAEGRRLFPAGLKLISHWGLRDELKSQYAASDGLPRQQMIYQVMLRIIQQEIPAAVINSDQVDWQPFANTLSINGKPLPFEREADIRYQTLLEIFQAERLADPFYPMEPSKIDRRFLRDREIPEEKFEAMLVELLTDPVGKKVADLIRRRLRRDLQPFDIWYNGFKTRSQYEESELDRRVAERYPSVQAFHADLPNIFSKLGFSESIGAFLAEKIVVDPSRGAGHAMGAMMRQDNAHLRTRIEPGGMNYKGYNIAIHELGHNVEQVFSLNRIDHTLLQGVPNTAFTEAFAFVFQSRDLALLELEQKSAEHRDLQALDTFWATCEIAAVGLVDMKVWHWMTDHPSATPAELRVAVVQIARDVWNQYWAPLIGQKDSEILAIYSHMIDIGLYLPDYSLGHIIMFQIEDYLRDKNLAVEMERMCRLGRLTPEAWMQDAVGQPISVAPLLQATRKAVAGTKK